MTQKRTAWFRPAIKPVHEGVYETRVPNDSVIAYSLWKDGEWKADKFDFSYAASETWRSYCQTRDWRGLTSRRAR